MTGSAWLRCSDPGSRPAMTMASTAASAATPNAMSTPPAIGRAPRDTAATAAPPDADAEGDPQHVGQVQRRRRPSLTPWRRRPQHHERGGRVAQAHAQPGGGPGHERLPDRHARMELPRHADRPGEDQQQTRAHQPRPLPRLVQAGLDPRADGPRQRRGGHDGACHDGAVVPNGRDRQRDVGVGPEEGEGEEAAAQDGGGQPAGGTQRSGRKQPAQRREPDEHPGCGQAETEDHVVRTKRSEHQGGTCGSADSIDHAMLVVRSLRVRTAEPHERGHGNGPGHHDQRDQAEEHPAPPEQVGDACRHGRPDDPRDDPCRRQHCHHPGPLHLAEAAAYGDVGHGRHGARPEALEAASHDEHPHRRSEARHEEARREQHQAHHVRPRRPVPVGVAAGQDDAHQAGQFEAREDPPVQCQALEVACDHRHHGDHGQRLGCDEGHGEHEPECEGSPLRRPQTVVPIAPAHDGETTGGSRWYCAAGRAHGAADHRRRPASLRVPDDLVGFHRPD